MKRKSILLALTLLLFASVTFAATIKNYEEYTGRRTYTVTDTKSSSIFDLNRHYKITTTFSSIYEKGSNEAVKKLTLQYDSAEDAVISIRPAIKLIIDDQTWQVTSKSHSTVNSDGSTQFIWTLPTEVIKSLMETKKAITVKFFYSTPNGDCFKEYTIPYKIVATVQTMYLQNIEPVNSLITE
ncbi:hypothetical protein [Sporomusa sp.]|uniref:hypothetical protein n=1 Tax=Sporomusa sp. TaxID=2078658 RepID=UPI002BB9A855|nr:hypothetical protein [Sporomusa sp.]HWR08041.1 hypothetical protein [Sporomusa sp.]